MFTAGFLGVEFLVKERLKDISNELETYRINNMLKRKKRKLKNKSGNRKSNRI